MKKYLVHITYLVIIAFLVTYSYIKADDSKIANKRTEATMMEAMKQHSRAEEALTAIQKLQAELKACQRK